MFDKIENVMYNNEVKGWWNKLERKILHVDVNNAFLSWTAVDRLKNGEHLKVGSIKSLIDINDTKCIEPLLSHKDSVIVFMGCKEVYDLKEKLEKVLRGN